ncbi:hypothetical protein BT63DRAFT_273091 [Microthyrium microscopicum]|uniref:DNA-directed RNA polymerase subunit n=1 Tax=Microthyrium microscopicum TaxID=703497 RepID=A0A6A6UAH5_9PEZI|nr:hypothetical protein BT63DRAFT_273091 [Microthyrium microscopicum]
MPTTSTSQASPGPSSVPTTKISLPTIPKSAVPVPSADSTTKKKKKKDKDESATPGKEKKSKAKKDTKKSKRKDENITETQATNGTMQDIEMGEPTPEKTPSRYLIHPTTYQNAFQHKPFDSTVTLEGTLTRPTSSPANSSFKLITAKMYLPVPPVGNSYTFEASCANSLSTALLGYHPPVKGIVVAYRNAAVSAPPKKHDLSLAQLTDGYADSYIWVSAELLVFRPNKGAWLSGQVTLQTESHIALIVKGLWNASIARSRLPKSWRWIADLSDDASSIGGEDVDVMNLRLGGAGAWHDGNGNPVGGMLDFRARDFDLTMERDERTVVSIEGSLLTEEQDLEITALEEMGLVSRATSRMPLGQSRPQSYGGTPRATTEMPTPAPTEVETPAKSAKKKSNGSAVKKGKQKV